MAKRPGREPFPLRKPNPARDRGASLGAAEPPAGEVDGLAASGLSDPGLLLAKAVLIQRIRDVVAERGATSERAAELLGVDASTAASLVRGQGGGLSLDRLVKCLTALGQRIEITVGPASGGAAPGVFARTTGKE